MSESICPLHLAALSHPNQIYLKQNGRCYSYFELDQYVNLLTQKLSLSKKVYATLTNDLFFNSALLFHCLRTKSIFFPLNPKLPQKVIQDYLKMTSVDAVFDEPISSKNTTTELGAQKPRYDPDAPLTYLLTSGSSGNPKIAVHSFANHWISAQTSNDYLNYNKGMTWLHSLPVFHVSGLSLIFRTIAANAQLVKSDNILETIQNENLTHISLVPTQLKRLINIKSLQQCTAILLGGALIESSLFEKALSLNLSVYKSYGLTETSSQVATYNPATKKVTLLSQRELMISPDGEVLVKGPTLFKGYLTNKGITLPLDAHGWFHTGDLGSYCDNNLIIQGRKDNLFISGGENIQPEEIEKILLKHPNITQAIVVPVDDPEYGQRPFAFINSTESFSQESLNSFLQEYLPKYKHPLGYSRLQVTSLKPSRHSLKLKAGEIYAKMKTKTVIE